MKKYRVTLPKHGMGMLVMTTSIARCVLVLENAILVPGNVPTVVATGTLTLALAVSNCLVIIPLMGYRAVAMECAFLCVS